MGIHAYLLWADFGWIGKKPSLKPKPQIVTLTLVSRPMPKAEPAPKLTRPLSPPAPEPAPKPEPKPEPKSTPEPKPRPAPKSEPEPSRERVSEIKATPLPSEKQIPSRFISESKPVPDTRPDPLTGEEKPHAPASLPGPAARPRTMPKSVEPAQSASAGPDESLPAPAIIRMAKPRYSDNPPPQYPIIARKRGYQGTVIFDVFIDKNDRVADIKVFSSSGYAVLDKAARTTVQDWLFEPGMKGEEKIGMWVRIPIRYQLK